jgi:hypothetical protein
VEISHLTIGGMKRADVERFKLCTGLSRHVLYRMLGTVILTMKNKLKAVRCDNCKYFNHTDKPRYDGACTKDNEYTAEHRVCNKLPTDDDRRNAKLRRNG